MITRTRIVVEQIVRRVTIEIEQDGNPPLRPTPRELFKLVMGKRALPAPRPVLTLAKKVA